MPSSSDTVGRVAWKSTNPSGSISAKRAAHPRRGRASRRRASPPARRRSSRGRPRSGPGGAASARRRCGAPDGRPSRDLTRGPPVPPTGAAGTARARSRRRAPAGGRQSRYVSRDRERPDRRREEDVDEDEPPGKRVPVLDLAQDHLRDEDDEQRRPTTRRTPGSVARLRQRKRPSRRKPIPNAAATRTWT